MDALEELDDMGDTDATDEPNSEAQHAVLKTTGRVHILRPARFIRTFK